MKDLMLRIAVLGVAAVLAACTQAADKRNNTSGGLSQGSETPMVGSASMRIVDGSTEIVGDGVAPTDLQLRANRVYSLILDAATLPAGTTFTLNLTNTSIPGGLVLPSQTLRAGVNNFSVPSQGIYSLRVVISAPGFSARTQTYSVSATCETPTFSAGSLNGNLINITQVATQNGFEFNASSMVAGANGVGPYECSWDMTGANILSTGFGSCANQRGYVDLVDLRVGDEYVGRNVGVIVRDACGVTQRATRSFRFPWSPTPYPGNVFIEAQTSSACVGAACDPRVDNVDYVGTNFFAPRPVIADWSGGVFNVESALNYRITSASVAHGMKVEVEGIVPPTATGSVDMSNARIRRITFSTDRGGDSQSQLVLETRNCTYTERRGEYMFAAGVPCAPGETGSNDQMTIEIGGRFSCTGMTGGGKTVNIQGRFNGLYRRADSCIGGGGGGGGGIVPIEQ